MVDWKKGDPPQKGNYLITASYTSKSDDNYELRLVSIDHYNGDGKWTDYNHKHKGVIAWAELPECYKGE